MAKVTVNRTINASLAKVWESWDDFGEEVIPFYESSIENLQVATVGSEENPALHFVQEDVPEELSTTLVDWIDRDFTVEEFPKIRTEGIAFEGFNYRSNFLELSNGLDMHFLDEGEGNPLPILN